MTLFMVRYDVSWCVMACRDKGLLSSSPSGVVPTIVVGAEATLGCCGEIGAPPPPPPPPRPPPLSPSPCKAAPTAGKAGTRRDAPWHSMTYRDTS